MGNQNYFRTLKDMIKDIILHNVNEIKEDSILYEEVNYEAFNIYFRNEKKLYCLQIEVNSGIDVHLSYHHGYLKNGDKSFITDSIMNENTLKEIKKIKKNTRLNYDLRLIKIITFLCQNINIEN